MRFYNYKRYKCQRVLILLAFLIIVILTLIYLLSSHIENALFLAFEDKAKQKIIEISNKSILEVIDSHKINYNDIVFLEQKGEASFIRIDTIYINKLISNWILSINQKMDNLMPMKIRFKLGYLFKNIFFYDMGPTIEGRVLSVSAISSDIQSDFKSAGINQTIHRLYLIIDFDVNILFLSNKKDFNVIQKVPIAENIYVGEVPKVYIGK